jgi:hypothetical protein
MPLLRMQMSRVHVLLCKRMLTARPSDGDVDRAIDTIKTAFE